MRNLFVSFRKIMTSRGFWLCVGMTVLLLFSAEVYTDYDTQNRYSVFFALTDLSGEEMTAHYELCNIMVTQNARGGWFTMFAPIIAAFCFVPLMCSEREGNAVRFQIFRTTKLKYSVTEFLSGVIAGGLAITLGYLVFSGGAMLLFPDVSEMAVSEMGMLKNVLFDFPKLTLEVFLYGGFWSTPAMFCTSILRNKYLVMCIPFFAKYAIAQVCQKILLNALSFDSIDEKKLKFANIIDPDGILWVSDSTRFNVILVFGVSAVVFFTAFIIIMRKRGDQGA